MERTLISFNLPNIITINLIVLGSALVIALGVQFFRQASGNANTTQAA